MMGKKIYVFLFHQSVHGLEQDVLPESHVRVLSPSLSSMVTFLISKSTFDVFVMVL